MGMQQQVVGANFQRTIAANTTNQRILEKHDYGRSSGQIVQKSATYQNPLMSSTLGNRDTRNSSNNQKNAKPVKMSSHSSRNQAAGIKSAYTSGPISK